ncbi:YrbL family protein [Achromobacter aloeverae]|uniref:PhoP regulatory network protein YrbL n=1 Tax=Achromobacter aloeverae TaxID=1750518 RepID=A0A4Q1HEN4_9BURK|nr:YrbL family protein [Achromobacter aloeverae]RXN83922.1 hypothetical protein C7R54_27110 [Achromobacter aloeverae]
MSIVPLQRHRPAAQTAPPPAFVPGHGLPFNALQLDELVPIASGTERSVYQHPYEPNLLVKVVNRRAFAATMNKHPWRRLSKALFQREGAYSAYIHELAEYAAAHNAADGRWQIPMARVVGLAETSQGLGVLVEKISDGEGGLAPTVEEIVKRAGQLEPELARQLAFFFDSLADHHIILNDISARNIVMGENAQGRHGLYLIDGFGSKQAVPIYILSKALNRRRIQRKVDAMIERLKARTLRAQRAQLAETSE